jgi:hypothetical protein
VNNVHGIIVAKTRREKNLYLFDVNVRMEMWMCQRICAWAPKT